jgi:ubiquitin
MIDEKDQTMKRIIEREEPGSRGPWKWQLINLLTSIDGKLDVLVKAEDLKTKRAKAGRASAEARKKKFGSAVPPSIQVEKQEVPPTQLALVDCVPEQKKKTRKPKPPSDGSLVWEAYRQSFQDRYRVAPLRGARENKHCSDLVRTLGLELARRLVVYYVNRMDAFYVNSKHPLGLLIVNLQKLNTEFQNGTQTTMSDARRAESHASIDRAIRQYADQQEAKEVENVG